MVEIATLKDALKGKFSAKQLEKLKLSFDMVGDIATINPLPKGMIKKEKAFANAVMAQNKHIKVVAKKMGATSGEERIRKVKVVAGEKRTKTVYTENGCKYKLDINKVYFSPRLGTEHLRVASQVKAGEKVFDLFAGVGPFVIPTAKRLADVIAIDLNKNATKYLKENVELNRVGARVEVYTGDARKVVAKQGWKSVADRVIMNLPMHAGDFLDLAFKLAKKGTVVHFYSFLHENELFKVAEDKIKAAAKKSGKKVKFLVKKTCGQLSPRVWRTVIDFKVV